MKQVNDDEALTQNDDNLSVPNYDMNHTMKDKNVDPDNMVEAGNESPKRNDDFLVGTTTPPKYVAKSNAVTAGSVTATKKETTSKKSRKHVVHSSSKNL